MLGREGLMKGVPSGLSLRAEVGGTIEVLGVGVPLPREWIEDRAGIGIARETGALGRRDASSKPADRGHMVSPAPKGVSDILRNSAVGE